MQKLNLFLLALILLAQPALAQFVPETWEEKPALHPIDAKFNNESAVIVLDKRRVEYVDEKETMVLYKTLHRIVHIQDDKGIESFNRVYLPVTDNSELADIRARTILPNGRIVEISRENVKDLKDDDDRVYKIFAMEGLEKGCEVEFLYTYKRDASFFGSEVLQTRFPTLLAHFDLVCPKRLVFEMKPYNTPTRPASREADEKTWLTVDEKDIPGAEEEKYCALEANMKRFEFKLAYNLSRATKERLLTWDELAKRIYENYTTTSDKEMKKAGDLVDQMKVKNLPDETARIVAVENFIKKNFTSRDDIGGEDAANLEKIVKSKLASPMGIVRLYSAVFRQLNIPHEFVLTADRNKNSIDRNFENWNNTDNPVIYFPNTKKCLAPTLSEFRYPWIDPNWAGANAFFCKTTTIGTFTTAVGEVRFLPLEDYARTHINTEADIRLNTEADTLLVDIRQIYAGYAASPYRAIFNFSNDEYRKKVTKDMIKFGTNSENVVSTKRENEDFESYFENKPFVLSATVKASELVERAGNKIIVKIGEIIGPQVEMYQEKPRQFPMEIDYPHILARKINFTIPEGYTVKNLDDLKMDIVYQDKGQTTMGFTAGYVVEGNVVKVTILEEYRRTSYPLAQFEDFKKVINAAADFNKVALVLEKK